MNELDQFAKRGLKIKYYARYADDFVIVSENKKYLEEILPLIMVFLKRRLKLELHPDKVSIRKYSQGIDFLGYVARPKHNLLRGKTKQRILKKMRRKAEELRQGLINEGKYHQSLNSYLSVLSHADAYELGEELKNIAIL